MNKYVDAGIDGAYTALSFLAGYMAANGAIVLPTKAVWVYALILGAVGALNQLRGLNQKPITPTIGKLGVLFLAIGLGGLLAGCSTISANPVQDVVTPAKGNPLGKVIVQGLQDASFNLDSAVTVGALDAADPAPACFHSILKQLGIDNASPSTPAASFTPRRSDLISEGSVLYIRARQAQRFAGQGVSLPNDCKALVAQFMLDAAATAVRTQPGGGLLPVIR